MVEDDAELLGQMRLVVGLQRPLRRRQARPLRVVDQVEDQAAVRLAVAHGVELPEPRDATLEHPVAALAVDVVPPITRQRGGDLHTLPGQKPGQIRMPRLA
ncbi:hypothetical protein D3C86_1645140 [compost metagenome]